MNEAKKERIRKRILAYKRERFKELNLRQYLRQGGKEMKEETIGKVTEGAFILRDFVGNGESKSGQKFEMCVSATKMTPILTMDGKAFTLSWNDVVKLAERAGFFREKTV